MEAIEVEEKVYPLTLPQQDIYYEQALFPEIPIYNIGAKIKIIGIIDISTLKQAYKNLIDTHDAYRTVVVKTKENVGFKILKNHRSVLKVVDFTPFSNADERANMFMKHEFKKNFALDHGTLLHRFILVKVSKNSHYLFSVYHHIITDGWGTSLMFQRLVQFYNELFEDGKVKSSYPFSYLSFLEDDISYQKSEYYEKDKKYWTTKFTNLPESPFPLVNKKDNGSRRHDLLIKRDIYNKLNILAKELKVTSFHCFLAILFSYFGRLYSRQDFAVGLPALNRSKATFKKTVGLFMGINPLRLQLEFENSFEDLCLQIKEELRKNYRHQRFPLGKLIRELNLYDSREKVFNLSLSYEKQNYSDSFTGTKTEVIPLSHESGRVALAVYIREFDEKEDVKIDFDYNLNYFNKKSIVKIVRHFNNLLEEIIETPRVKLKDLNFLSTMEKERILVDFNNTGSHNPKKETLLDFVEKQVENFGEKIAIEDGSNSFSYKELKTKSDQFAFHLNTILSIKNSEPVVVLMKRSSNLPLVLLGILKSGRPFIPLDPIFPSVRIKFIIEHCKAKALITEKSRTLDFEVQNIQRINFEDLLLEDLKMNHFKMKEIAPLESAYIIYTSGSTGNPKGVEISHKSLINFLLSMKKQPGINKNDIFFAVTTYSFDISILELFLPIISGSKLFIVSDKTLQEPEHIIELLKHCQPTIIQATPSFFQMLFNVGWEGSKKLKILCGGDLLSDSLTKKLIKGNREVWNMYGPTETTIWSSIKKMERPKDGMNIGKPIQNTSFYILDQWLNPIPIGADGDIYIGGEGLAKGYYLNQSQTKERFIINPYNSQELIYKTGDLGRWNDRGEVIFLGRSDNQVKIHGYRIELREIEQKLMAQCGFKEAIVIAKKQSGSDAYLIGFVKSNLKNIKINGIIENLRKVLPEYMIPKIFIPVRKFPITPNRKIDRQALEQIDVSVYMSSRTRPNAIKLESRTEKKLKELWETVLEFPIKNPNGDFFALGGHSIKAAQLVNLINNHFKIKLRIKDVFNQRSIYGQSQLIESSRKEEIIPIPKTRKGDNYPIAKNQEGLWLACQTETISRTYNMYAAFEVFTELDLEILEKALTFICLRHEILRTNFVYFDGAPRQRITPESDFKIKATHVVFTSKKKCNQFIERAIQTTFNLEEEQLLKIFYLKALNQNPILLFLTHHLIMDGLSMEVFTNELATIYEALRNKAKLDISCIRTQFKDYAAWSLDLFEREASEALGYWFDQFKGFKAKPIFRKNTNEQKCLGDILSFNIEQDLFDRLMKQAKELEVTVFSVLLSSIKLLIYSLFGERDFCIGVPVSGRNHPDIKNMIGMFVNVMPLRCKLEKKETFESLCAKTMKQLNYALDNETSPLKSLIEKLNLPSNIFEVAVVYQNPNFNIFQIENLGGVRIKSIPLEHHTSRFPITFNFFEFKNRITCEVEYKKEFFEVNDVMILIEKYKKLLSQSLKDYDIPIDKLNLNFDVWKQPEVKISFNF